MESKCPDLDRIVYVDVEFVSQRYEQITGTPAQSIMTRTEGGRVGVNIAFASAGVHTQQSRTYPISSTKMLEEIFDNLQKKYDRINLDTWENGNGSRIGWITGNLTVGIFSRTRRVGGLEEEKEEHQYYELHCGSKRLALLPKTEYFSPGFCDMLEISAVLKPGIDIPVPVEMLVRVLYQIPIFDGTYHLSVPLLAFERGAAGRRAIPGTPYLILDPRCKLSMVSPHCCDY